MIQQCRTALLLIKINGRNEWEREICKECVNVCVDPFLRAVCNVLNQESCVTFRDFFFFCLAMSMMNYRHLSFGITYTQLRPLILIRGEHGMLPIQSEMINAEPFLPLGTSHRVHVQTNLLHELNPQQINVTNTSSAQNQSFSWFWKSKSKNSLLQL